MSIRNRALGALIGVALLLTLTPVVWAAPPSRVAYTVTVADIPNKTYRITARAEGLTEPAVTFAIPAWTPGWYVLFDFYKNISGVSATGPDGTPLTVTPRDRQTWQVETGGAKSVTIAYDLKAVDRDFGFFNAYLDARNGFVSGPAALMYVVDGKTAPCRITYRMPVGWKVASANAPTDDPNTFTAPDYDTLADQPADLGSFLRYDRKMGGVPVSVILVGADGLEHQRFVDEVYKITEAGIRVFGSTPFPRYLYHFRFTPRGFGGMGLEHLNSTVIRFGQSALRSSTSQTLTAHEFVHAWNVKRLRPAALGPFDYTKAVRVKDLWFAEGVTEYYAPRLMVEAGLGDKAFWLSYLAANIAELQNNPARRRVTLEQASLRAWEGRSEGFDGLSYYNKGMLVGLLLDIEMRHRTQNRVGLDALMKYLYRQTELTGKGFADGAIEAAAAKLTGTDFGPFFDRALRSTEELPLAETLAKAGLHWGETVTAYPFLGVEWDFTARILRGARVGAVVPGSAAARAGLRPGDVLTAVDGKALTDFQGSFLQEARPGQTVTLTVVRGNSGPQAIEAALGRREERAYRLTELPGATPLQRSIVAALTGDASPLLPNKGEASE